MGRRSRLALLVAGILCLVVAGSTLANRAPSAQPQPAELASSHEPQAETPPTVDEIAHATERLSAKGIVVDEAAFTDLANRFGVGGAVRLYAWSNETGLGVDALAAMREDGAGWGRIARELGVHPGLGSIMGKGRDKSGDTSKGKPAESPAPSGG